MAKKKRKYVMYGITFNVTKSIKKGIKRELTELFGEECKQRTKYIDVRN